MTDSDFVIKRSAILRPLPVLIKSKLDILVLIMSNEKTTIKAIVKKCQQIHSYIDTLTKIEYLNANDVEQIQHYIFLAELQVLTGIKNIAIDTINDAIKVITKKIIINLIIRKRLESYDKDDLGTLDCLPWTAREIIINNLI